MKTIDKIHIILQIITPMFLLNSISTILIFYKFYIDEGYRVERWDIYIPFSVVHLILSIMYGISFGYLKLYDDTKPNIKKWVLVFFVIFTTGLFIYGLNKFIYNIWTYKSWDKWILTIFFEYLGELVFKYYLHIIISVFNGVCITIFYFKKHGNV